MSVGMLLGLRALLRDGRLGDFAEKEVAFESRKRRLELDVRYVLLLSTDGERLRFMSETSVTAVSLLTVGA